MTPKPQMTLHTPLVSGVSDQEASLDIWDKKYRLKSKDGTVLDQTMDGTYQRLARTLSEVEKDRERAAWYEKFLWALRQGAIPAGRIVSNAGATEHKPATSTINCTVSGSIRDSMDDILRKVHEAGLTLKAGCGIGYEFSTLRPRGAYVSGAGAYTSGPLSFMDIYDRMCFTVSSAGGRRGAQMGTFDVGHPDVLEFVRAKREDGRLRQFNLSLLISRGFMEAVKADQPWPLAFPIDPQEAAHVDLKDPRLIIWREWPVTEGYVVDETGCVACKIYKTVPARHLWDVIMRSTYDYAEPGFILIDRINEMNNNWWCENIRATNPCITADTWVQTSEGPRQVQQLIGRQFCARVDGKDYRTGPEGFFLTARKPVVRLSAREGYSLRLTAEHQVRRVRGDGHSREQVEWCEAGKLLPGDKVLLHNHRTNPSWPGDLTFSEGYLIGFLIGDGSLLEDQAILPVWSLQQAVVGDETLTSASATSLMDAVSAAAREALALSKTPRGWSEVHRCAVGGSVTEYRFQSAALRQLAAKLGLSSGHKGITPIMECGSSEFYRGVLRGLFDTDGSVPGTQEQGVSVRLSQSDRALLEAVQRMLLRLGVVSTIDRRRFAGTKVLPDGRGSPGCYETQEQFELVIAKDNLSVFRDVVGFCDSAKAARLDEALKRYCMELNLERFAATVANVQDDGEEPVYDVQVPGIHAFDGNGLYVHNCGEQPLPPYGSCLLGSVNLTKFVHDPFTDRARFDFETYREVVRIFTRMLDNVVEVNGLPLAPQRGEIERKRRHGMGFLGLGSTLALLRMRYGSPESVAFTESIAREMALAGWREALALAREKGPAPIMAESVEITPRMLRQRPELARDGYRAGQKIPARLLHARYSRYMQQLAEIDPELVAQLAETGARFTHHTSIAPTGTISLALANNASNGIEPSFAHSYYRNVIRPGRKTKERVQVFSYELLAYRTLIDGESSPDMHEGPHALPDYFVTSDHITPREHVDIQAAAQKWVDSSISKTANVPTDFPYDEFKDIYLYAYEKELKGCTTFRFNPAVFQGVLVKGEDLANTLYRFVLEDGTQVEARGDEQVEYDGEEHTAANLFDALKEGYYGKW